MNKQPIELARDSDLRLSHAALLRAAQRARELAKATGTTLVVSRNGSIEHLEVLADGTLRVQERPASYANKAL